MNSRIINSIFLVACILIANTLSAMQSAEPVSRAHYQLQSCFNGKLKTGQEIREGTKELIQACLADPTHQSPELRRNIFHALCYTKTITIIDMSSIAFQYTPEQRQASLSQYDHEGKTPLQAAVFRGNLYLVEFYISLGANVLQLTDQNSKFGAENLLSLTSVLSSVAHSTRENLIIHHISFYLEKHGILAQAINQMKPHFKNSIQEAKKFLGSNNWPNLSCMYGFLIPHRLPDNSIYAYCSLCSTRTSTDIPQKFCTKCKRTFITNRFPTKLPPPAYIPPPAYMQPTYHVNNPYMAQVIKLGDVEFKDIEDIDRPRKRGRE